MCAMLVFLLVIRVLRRLFFVYDHSCCCCSLCLYRRCHQLTWHLDQYSFTYSHILNSWFCCVFFFRCAWLVNRLMNFAKRSIFIRSKAATVAVAVDVRPIDYILVLSTSFNTHRISHFIHQYMRRITSTCVMCVVYICRLIVATTSSAVDTVLSNYHVFYYNTTYNRIFYV